MKAELYLMKFKRKDGLATVQRGLGDLFDIAGFDKVVGENDLTAVKVHFGEEGVTSYIPADYISPMVQKIKKQNACPFVSDTNVLYKSRRSNAVDHILLAKEHGFTIDSLGAPVIIADGICGVNETKVEINGLLNEYVFLADEYVHANSMIMSTHVTGHILTGLGATIKNLGMGCSSRKGKLAQHSVTTPFVAGETCTKCLECVSWCPENALIEEDSSVVIDQEKCIGCGECLAVCRYDAVQFRWDSPPEELQRQIAEHALGMVKLKRGRIGYYTFLINMTKDCDCMKQGPDFLMDDIGVLAGTDPVAIDQAVLDLTANVAKNQRSIADLSYPSIDSTVQLEYGEKIGLGIRSYVLKEV